MFIPALKDRLGIVYVVIAAGVIATIVSLAVRSIGSRWTDLQDQYDAYQNILDRRRDVGWLKEQLTQFGRQLEQRSDILVIKSADEGFVFLEKTVSDIAQKNQVRIVGSSRQTFRETNGFTPVALNVRLRVPDANIHNLFLDLDEVIERNLTVDKLSINLANAQSQTQEPEVEISIELALLCRKAGI